MLVGPPRPMERMRRLHCQMFIELPVPEHAAGVVGTLNYCVLTFLFDHSLDPCL